MNSHDLWLLVLHTKALRLEEQPDIVHELKRRWHGFCDAGTES